ncbi:MAG: ThiF family adenylyltransferase [Mucilaginibacter sp.]|nr:ThiF family adenylyltransferase [Mucilaginibacter sp.]
MELQLRISGYHYEKLKDHLLPRDGKESVAVAICGRYSDGENEILLVHDITLIPDEECYSRENDKICWPTEKVISYFERISKNNLAMLKIHSHPGGYDRFSTTDDVSDKEFFESVFAWSINDKPHASAVMLPSGEIFGRFFFSDLKYKSINKISIVSDIIMTSKVVEVNEDQQFALRTIQAFGGKTFNILNQLTIAVIGCSGTGSPVIEQLVRLGVGKIILVDPDYIEEKNLNRIINATKEDALSHISKVDMLSKAIKNIGLNTLVECYQTNLYDSLKALSSLVKCDVIFGCMDSVDGRHLLNQLCTFYLIPYFDLGVKLEADGVGGIKKICCSVHYLQPGKSSLISRGMYTDQDLRAASQLRKNIDEYENLKKNAYIKNVNVNSPAVISVNMQIASHAINEFLNRIHKYKIESNSQYALSTIDITENYIVNVDESDFEVDEYLRRKVGRGDMIPFIEMPELNA